MGRSRTDVAFLLAIASLAPSLWAQGANPLTTAVTERFNRVRIDAEESAEVMPEAKYTFRLTDAQRTFAEWIAHLATGNYSFCSVIRGEKPPEKTKQLPSLKTKAELVPALKESFAYCAEVLKTMDDQKALAPAGPNNVPPVRGMINLVSSDNEHYGNIVGYMRANNIVPPSTARAERQQKSSGKK